MRLVDAIPGRVVRWLLAAIIGLAMTQIAYSAEVADDPWPDLRASLFGDRPIHDGVGVIGLDAPNRAQDAAIVPVSMVAQMPQHSDRFIKTITLIVDQNPAPVAAVFGLSPDNGSATISARIRIDAYTHVRAIAETNDGALYMAAKFVKASGGCSAPAVKNDKLAMSQLGKIELKQPAQMSYGQPIQVQLLISHPNHSGLQMDQLTRNFTPARYVRDIEVTLGDRTVLTMEGGISLSEDPSIKFSLVPDAPGEIAVRVSDSDDATFSAKWPTPRPAGL